MRHTLAIERVTPWSEFNEHEGWVEGRVDGHPVGGRVVLVGEPWEEIKPGQVREIWAYFERGGELTRVTAGTPAELGQAVIVGTVHELDCDRAIIDSVLRVEVDLCLGLMAKRAVPNVRVGDRIRVEGQLEIAFDPDDYEDDQ